MSGPSIELLQKQRRGALVTEVICFAVALIGPAIGWYILRDKLDTLAQIPAALWAPMIPPVLLFLAGIGFHRHRRGIERQLREATESARASR